MCFGLICSHSSPRPVEFIVCDHDMTIAFIPMIRLIVSTEQLQCVRIMYFLCGVEATSTPDWLHETEFASLSEALWGARFYFDRDHASIYREVWAWFACSRHDL